MTPYTVHYFISKHVTRDSRGSVLYVKILIYARINTPNSEELFLYEAAFSNCGVFCLH